MIEFDCPNCHEHISVPDQAAGRAGVCPKCDARVVAPGGVAGGAPAAGQDAPASATVCATPPESPVEQRPDGAPNADWISWGNDDDPDDPTALNRKGRKQCPFCGKMISATAVKCRLCGKELTAAAPPAAPVVCPSCTAMIPAGVRQCEYCGKTLDAESAPVSAVAPEGDTGRNAAASDDTGRHGAVKTNTGRHAAVKGIAGRSPARMGGGATRSGAGSFPSILAGVLALAILIAVGLYLYQASTEQKRQRVAGGTMAGGTVAGGTMAGGTVAGGTEKWKLERLADLRRRAKKYDIVALMILATEYDDVAAQVRLGSSYLHGWEVPVDWHEAEKWYKMAATHGNAVAIAALDRMAQQTEWKRQETATSETRRPEAALLREAIRTDAANSQATQPSQPHYTFDYRLDDQGNAILCRRADGVPCIDPKPDGALIVPESIDGHTITGIEDQAFVNCERMTRIVLPPRLERLPVWISDWDVYGNVFAGCRALASIEIATTNPQFTSENGALYSKDKQTLFAYPKNREEITLARETTKIDGSAFDSCQFTVAKIPEGITNFGAFVFARCANLKIVEFPKSTQFIGHRLFVDCPHMKKVVFRGDAPEAYFRRTQGRENMFYGANNEIVLEVMQGSKDWAGKDTTHLPERWPLDGSDSRPIRYIR